MSAIPKSASPPTLKLFDGNEPSPPAPAGERRLFPVDTPNRHQDAQAADPRQYWTLLECYEALVLPDMRADSKAKSTISGDYTALHHWNTRTTNPRVREIENGTVSAFRTSLLAGDPDRDVSPMATRTVSKTWATIRKILRRIGPPDSGNPQGEGIITRVAYLSPLKHKKTRPRVLLEQQVNLVYDACSIARWPRIKSLPAPLFWRTAIVLWYFYGIRTQDLAAYTSSAIGLEWDEVSLDPQSPDPQSEAMHEHGWLNFTPQKTEQTRGENLVLPLHEMARRHLDAIRGDRKRVFPNPYCNKSYYAQWTAIQQHAGFAANPFEIGDLRKTCNNLWNRKSAGLGGWILGHCPRGTNAQFYTLIEPQILDTLPLIPVPASFRSDLGGRQLKLF